MTKRQKMEAIRSLPDKEIRRLINLANDRGACVQLHDFEKNHQGHELLLSIGLLTNEDHTDYEHIHVYEPTQEFYKIMEELQ